jgi:hypothetical protein
MQRICILWRSCNLTTFTSCLTGPVDYLFASRHEGPGFNSPGGYLCEIRILLFALSRCIGDPDVIWSLALLTFSGCFTRLHADNVKSQRLFHPSVGASLGFEPTMCKPTWSHTALLSRFHARCRSSFWLHNHRVSCSRGEPCGEPLISLRSHYVSLVQWTTHLLPVMRDPGSNSQGGTYVKPGFSCKRCLATICSILLKKKLACTSVYVTVSRINCSHCTVYSVHSARWTHLLLDSI